MGDNGCKIAQSGVRRRQRGDFDVGDVPIEKELVDRQQAVVDAFFLSNPSG